MCEWASKQFQDLKNDTAPGPRPAVDKFLDSLLFHVMYKRVRLRKAFHLIAPMKRWNMISKSFSLIVILAVAFFYTLRNE